jgi:antirestriction protein ArdC
MPKNAFTKKQYRGVNVPLLWIRQQRDGYASGLWATYKQWQEAGAQVRKGEKGTPIVFWKMIDVEPINDDEEAGQRMFARSSTVFNVAQVGGFEMPSPAPRAEITLKDSCTAFVQATGAVIEHGHAMACYNITHDKIEMPRAEMFKNTKAATAAENYYAILLHELTHWSGAKHRLDRAQNNRYGDQDYAFEELVAELGAAMLCASLGVTPAPRDDHAQYIKNWLKALNGDQRFIFSAASQAQKAADYLYSLQPQQQQQAA